MKRLRGMDVMGNKDKGEIKIKSKIKIKKTAKPEKTIGPSH
jgi:hypothetical protein